MRRERLGGEERRLGIVQAAMPLFARSGFAGTTTREIARTAGISEALLFQHFPSKAALYAQILQSGCEGDPALEALSLLEPSTATLVRMTRALLGHFVLNEEEDEAEVGCRRRMVLHSLLDDGEYARLLFGWITERIFPLFRASLEVAAAAGDLRPGRGRPLHLFWFAHHVAAMTAYVRLNGRSAVPTTGCDDELFEDAVRFILRGVGLTDEAIDRHAVPRPTTS
jgi:AcrR family transcriptional regulator